MVTDDGRPRQMHAVGATVAPGYYDALLAHATSSPFLSPYRDRRYITALARWITADGGDVGEVGPGFGELVSAVARRSASISSFFVMDSSSAALAQARNAWSAPSSHLRLQHQALEEVPARRHPLPRVVRLVAINVLQDLSLEVGARGLKTLLAPSGRVRATVLARETMDDLYRESGLYDPATGLYFQPLPAGATAPQLGRRVVNGRAVKYGRVLQFWTLEQAVEAFAAAGLAVYRTSSIAFPAQQMIRRWKAQGTLPALHEGALERMRHSGAYVDSHELFAKSV